MQWRGRGPAYLCRISLYFSISLSICVRLERGGRASGGDASTVYRGFTDPAVCTAAATLESGVSQLCSNIGDISTAEKIYSQTDSDTARSD